MRATRGLAGFVLTLLVCAAAAAGFAPAAEAAPRESRYAAIVVDFDSGDVLHAVNPDRQSYPASLTKVMTLYLLFDALESRKVSLRTMLPVSSHAAAQAPSKLALRPGDRIAVEDAVLALVTKSANDVAVVVAEALGGSEDEFAEMMTRKARQLGMSSTTYRNASGLPDSGQISTPRDQARLGRALIRDHGEHYHYFSTRQFKWRGQPISTHNRLMLRYKGADGIKTGYINASGFNLIASAKRDGRRIVGVVFGGDTAGWRDRQMAQNLDKGFARLKGGIDIRSAQVEEEDRQDLDRLIASAKTGPQDRKGKVVMAAARPQDDESRGAGDAEPDSWSVQVGAFSAYKPAHKAASAAAKKLGGLVSRATIDVDKAGSGKKALYRARLSGFTEDQALAACKRLAKAKKDCKVVQPSA
ncbi:D-alanyl-D-alanine carboxypeptidase family protein [Magnetospirillum sp. UT-4]|uniref:D-alanyl-D-alanine carboxypeptidase family protein n=1 Tax=Magnetospirillum sp. UT-4 TaxID=2681467 RepID=UPI001385D7CB|nr:D-alanyl-D-alanine carboxypeptidase family protein [Magnetospirillum sp. UT-4]CAA7613383.1 D-alanyl-D-alanine carboxypeptidase [Magnetospirillum sp. UT-4]